VLGRLLRLGLWIDLLLNVLLDFFSVFSDLHNIVDFKINLLLGAVIISPRLILQKGFNGIIKSITENLDSLLFNLLAIKIYLFLIDITRRLSLEKLIYLLRLLNLLGGEIILETHRFWTFHLVLLERAT
jgi:hypothetical protein